MRLDGFDNNIDPLTSNCWGAIADYDSLYNDYELSDHEYVVYEGRVFYSETDVSAVRMRDYEDSMKWLNDAAKLRLNPQIPRKFDETKKPVTD